jgi:hypothetical protein
VHSKKDEFIIPTAIRAGAINLIYDTPSITSMELPTPNPKAKRYKSGCMNRGIKFTINVFMKTSLLRDQTFHKLPVSSGISKYDILSVP